MDSWTENKVFHHLLLSPCLGKGNPVRKLSRPGDLQGDLTAYHYYYLLFLQGRHKQRQRHKIQICLPSGFGCKGHGKVRLFSGLRDFPWRFPSVHCQTDHCSALPFMLPGFWGPTLALQVHQAQRQTHRLPPIMLSWPRSLVCESSLPRRCPQNQLGLSRALSFCLPSSDPFPCHSLCGLPSLPPFLLVTMLRSPSASAPGQHLLRFLFLLATSPLYPNTHPRNFLNPSGHAVPLP